MELSKILSINGKPGLYKMLTTAKTGVVVESLIDGKRTTVFQQYDISSLEEISIYTDSEDVPLKDVLKNIFDYTQGKEALSKKPTNKELKAFFAEVLPTYDRENVYTSHIKKVIQWYNILLSNDLLQFDEDKKETEAVDTDEKKGDS